MFLAVSSLAGSSKRLSEVNGMSQWIFLTPVTLTFDLWPWPTNLYVIPLDLHAKIQVCMSVHSSVKVVTDTHTDGVKIITPITSEMWGVINACGFLMMLGSYPSLSVCPSMQIYSQEIRRKSPRKENNLNIAQCLRWGPHLQRGLWGFKI